MSIKKAYDVICGQQRTRFETLKEAVACVNKNDSIDGLDGKSLVLEVEITETGETYRREATEP